MVIFLLIVSILMQFMTWVYLVDLKKKIENSKETAKKGGVKNED